MSYDMKALFTSVPIGPAIQDKLEQGKELQQRISMTVKNNISLLEFCLRKTYFLFHGSYYEQLKGATTGSPISSKVANLYMENFEVKALSTSPHTQDTFVVIKTVQKSGFLEHINSTDQCTQFTEEATRADGSMPYLDTLIISQPDGSLETTVYREPTHTDQYLHWNSHHMISAEYSVVRTLHHRASAVCSKLQLP